MLLLVNADKKQKKKYSISKEGNKFARQFDLTQKEIGINDKAIEATKNIMKEAIAKWLNELKKHLGIKPPTWTIWTKN